MKTFLEFVLIHCLSPPTRSSGNGISFWPCPKCEHDSFHTMPIKPRFKHRAKCWNSECDFRGDELDMLAWFYPSDTYDMRLDRFDQLQREWERRKKLLDGGRGFPKRRLLTPREFKRRKEIEIFCNLVDCDPSEVLDIPLHRREVEPTLKPRMTPREFAQRLKMKCK